MHSIVIRAIESDGSFSFFKSESLKLVISNCILLLPGMLCLPGLVYVFNPSNAEATKKAQECKRKIENHQNPVMLVFMG